MKDCEEGAPPALVLNVAVFCQGQQPSKLTCFVIQVIPEGTHLLKHIRWGISG